jgi:hypothetical protein
MDSGQYAEDNLKTFDKRTDLTPNKSSHTDSLKLAGEFRVIRFKAKE